MILRNLLKVLFLRMNYFRKAPIYDKIFWKKINLFKKFENSSSRSSSLKCDLFFYQNRSRITSGVIVGINHYKTRGWWMALSSTHTHIHTHVEWTRGRFQPRPSASDKSHLNYCHLKCPLFLRIIFSLDGINYSTAMHIQMHFCAVEFPSVLFVSTSKNHV